MNKRLSLLLALLLVVLCCCACTETSRNSSFGITFLDVGQGDSALVECDGCYMLIDGGEVQAGRTVRQALVDRDIQTLDILAMSHPHTDHIGGLIDALGYAQTEKLVISNTKESETKIFRDVKHQLEINGAEITVPSVGQEYPLGSAKVKVMDVASAQDNDALVLMITYGDTRFLFTGDIEYLAQKRLCDMYQNDQMKIDLIKMPHHGSYEDANLTRLIDTFTPDYAVISVGIGNRYGHPDQETIDLLTSKPRNIKVFRTDQNGEITVKSDGKSISVQTSR